MILGGVFIFIQEKNYLVTPKTEEEALKAEISNIQSPESLKELSKEEEILPIKFEPLNVPFTSQAPPVYGDFRNKPKWDDDHNEACEEAAILMVDAYLNDKNLTPEIADKTILRMLKFQEENYGKRNKDLEAKEVVMLAKDFYGYENTKIVYNVSIDDIKREVANGNPVILPTAGRLLFGSLSSGRNPYYRDPGPLYHMLVVIGYDGDRIITNDPGTRKGENFTFKDDVLFNALHEWNKGDIEKGRSAMIIIQK